jgi:hypothetical protein
MTEPKKKESKRLSRTTRRERKEIARIYKCWCQQELCKQPSRKVIRNFRRMARRAGRLYALRTFSCWPSLAKKL